MAVATRALATSAAPSSDAAPSVFDKLISLTIVDPSGARRKIPAMVGEYENCRRIGLFLVCGYMTSHPQRLPLV